MTSSSILLVFAVSQYSQSHLKLSLIVDIVAGSDAIFHIVWNTVNYFFFVSIGYFITNNPSVLEQVNRQNPWSAYERPFLLLERFSKMCEVQKEYTQK